MLPNFLIIGAEKAGTTSLASMLSKHSEIFMSPHKELHYFTHNWNKGIDWYKQYFEDVSDEKAIGEASPSYSWDTDDFDVPKRIVNKLGNIKYIYILRNPIDRFISHYHHAIIKGWIRPNTGVIEAISKVPGLLKCSLYFHQIDLYLKYSKKEQILIFSLEELTNNTNTIVRQICEFLKVKNEDLFVEHQNYSKNQIRQNTSIFYIKNLIRPILKPFLSNNLIRKVNSKSKVFDMQIEKPNIPESMKQELFNELKEDIEKLNKFCDMDFFKIWNLNYK